MYILLRKIKFYILIFLNDDTNGLLKIPLYSKAQSEPNILVTFQKKSPP